MTIDQVPKRMRALVYRGVNDLRMESIPVPAIGSDEVLVKVAVCGVCPTDIKKIQYGTVPPPRVFGHETAGTIVNIGSRVRGFAVGDRVGLHHHVPCLQCHFCQHRAFAQCATYKKTGITAGFEPAGGGFSEFVRVMPFVFPGMVKILARNSFLEGAMLEPVNTVLKAIRQLPLLKKDFVLVVGQGPIGLLFTKLLSLEGMKVIATDLLDERVRLARRWGAWKSVRGDLPSLTSEFDRWTEGRGLDAAVIAVPSDAALIQAQSGLRGGGTVLLFAHTVRGKDTALDLSQVCVDEKALVGSYSADFTLQAEVSRIVFSRRLKVRDLVTHQFSLESSHEAIALASHPTTTALKIVVVGSKD